MKYLGLKLVLLVTFVFALACKRNYVGDYLAPEMKVASADFAYIEDTLKPNFFNSQQYEYGKVSFVWDSLIITKLPGTPIRFDTAHVFKPRNTFFNIHFNEEVTWYIRLEGKTSGATKSLSGIGRYLDSTVTQAVWDGRSDGLEFFADGDSVQATLSVLGSEKIKTIDFVIVRNLLYNASEQVLLNDFEGGYSVITYGDDLDPFPNPAPDTRTDIPPIQGKFSMVIEGTDHNGDYFIGGYQQPFDASVFKGKNASDIYINMYVYGFGLDKKLTPNATKVNIGISEDDNLDGAFDPEKEDSFEQQVNVDWQGWKLVSVRYSNLKISTSRSNGGSGNNTFEPNKALSVNVNLISSPNGSTIGTALDYVILSFGKPFSK